jgi:hypothetical protein
VDNHATYDPYPLENILQAFYTKLPHQNAYKRDPRLQFHPIALWYKKTNEFGPIHILARIKMKKLGGGGMPQDEGYVDFLKNKLPKTSR